MFLAGPRRTGKSEIADGLNGSSHSGTLLRPSLKEPLTLGWAIYVAPVIDVLDDGTYLEVVIDPIVGDGPLQIRDWHSCLNGNGSKLGQTPPWVFDVRNYTEGDIQITFDMNSVTYDCKLDLTCSKLWKCLGHAPDTFRL